MSSYTHILTTSRNRCLPFDFVVGIKMVKLALMQGGGKMINRQAEGLPGNWDLVEIQKGEKTLQSPKF